MFSKHLEFFISDQETPPQILLEFCPMNLESVVNNKILSNPQIAYCIYQIAEGMKYIHFNRISHLNLKPSNILFANDETFKICDFAPSFDDNDDDFEYNEQKDIYSFGRIVFFILSGGNFPEIKTKMFSSGKKVNMPSEFTDFSKKLIGRCLNLNLNEQISFKSICEDLELNFQNLIEMSDSEFSALCALIECYKKRIHLYE